MGLDSGWHRHPAKVPGEDPARHCDEEASGAVGTLGSWSCLDCGTSVRKSCRCGVEAAWAQAGSCGGCSWEGWRPFGAQQIACKPHMLDTGLQG